MKLALPNAKTLNGYFYIYVILMNLLALLFFKIHYIKKSDSKECFINPDDDLD